MIRYSLAILLILCLALTGCALKSRELRLEEDDQISGLSGPEVESDLKALDVRVNSLWTELTTQKLTAKITKDKVAEYFNTTEELTEFIAIYASLFRELRFDREIVRRYKINKVTLEQNGVIALVDITIRGRIYLFWQAKVHEIQKWVKTDGKWYLQPQAY